MRVRFLLCNGDTPDVDFVAVLVELDERVSPLDPDALHAVAEVVEAEVSPSLRALVLLVVVVKVDALVVVQIDHLSLALPLTLRSLHFLPDIRIILLFLPIVVLTSVV